MSVRRPTDSGKLPPKIPAGSTKAEKAKEAGQAQALEGVSKTAHQKATPLFFQRASTTRAGFTAAAQPPAPQTQGKVSSVVAKNPLGAGNSHRSISADVPSASVAARASDIFKESAW